MQLAPQLIRFHYNFAQELDGIGFINNSIYTSSSFRVDPAWKLFGLMQIRP